MSIKPLSGMCFVRLEGRYDEKVGAIVIPQQIIGRKIGYGQIVAWNPTGENVRSFGGIPDPIGYWALCYDFAATLVIDGLYRIPIDHVLALSEQKELLTGGTSAFNGTERCKFCGPAKAEISMNSVILDFDGYCPRCGKNADGAKKDEFSEKALAPFMR